IRIWPYVTGVRFRGAAMELNVFLMVLVAALCHASWNALLKINGDRLIVMAVLTVAAGAISLLALPFAPLPAPASWPYIAVSVTLHTGYAAFLLLAYRKGDLSHVYPIARGLAPLLVSFAAVAVVGEELSREGVLAVGIIALGIMSQALT